MLAEFWYRLGWDDVMQETMGKIRLRMCVLRIAKRCAVLFSLLSVDAAFEAYVLSGVLELPCGWIAAREERRGKLK